MKDAIEEKPDELQEHSKELAEYILRRTGLSTGNSLTYSENEVLANQMRQVLAEPTRKESIIDKAKEKEYHAMLEYKIGKAIKEGRIPDPKDDPFMKRQRERMLYGR